jgi:chromosomal replication initiator protein
MRKDIGETECDFRVKATRSSNKLLALLFQHHGEDEDYQQVVMLEASIAPVVDMIPLPINRPIIEDIQNVVAESYGTTRAEIVSDRRNQEIIMPRHVAMYLCRELTPRSISAIARRFGDRDHTVVLYAIKKIERLMTSDPVLAAAVETIRARFEP